MTKKQNKKNDFEPGAMIDFHNGNYGRVQTSGRTFLFIKLTGHKYFDDKCIGKKITLDGIDFTFITGGRVIKLKRVEKCKKQRIKF